MRRVLIVLGGLVLLLVAAAVAGYIVLQQVDWNEYKQPIAEAAYDATGRKLDLGGDIDLQIGLQPGVRLDGIAFANADWGSREEMAKIERVVVRFRLLPLLSGELVVSRVEVVGLDLLLETREDGTPNWEFASTDADAPAQAPAAAPPAAEPSDAEEEQQAFAAVVQHAIIENAVVVIRDGKTGEEQRFAIVRLLARTDGQRGPLKLELDAEYGVEPIRLTGQIEGIPELMAGGSLDVDLRVEAGGAEIGIVGNIGMPLEGSDLDLDLSFETQGLGGLSALAGSELPNLGPIDIGLNLGGGGSAYAIRDLSVAIGSTKITGQVDASLAGERPKIDARLLAPRIDLADLQESGGVARVKAAPGILLVSETSRPSERMFSDDPLPLEGLAAVDAKLALAVEVLEASGIILSGVDLDLSLESQKLKVEHFTAGLAEGRLNVALTLDASRSKPPLSLSGRMRGVQAGLLAKSQGSEMIEGGPLDADFDLAGRGRSLHAIMAGLDGKFSLSMGQALLNDETAGLVLSDLGSVLRGGGGGGGKGATIECVWADFRIVDGVARPEGLVIHLGSIALFGDGKIDLGRERLDLEFDRQAQQLSASGVLPPFTVKGTLSEPKPGIAAGALAGKLVDLGASLLGSGDESDEGSRRERPSGCRELLALYKKEMAERGSTADVARKAADDLGGTAGKTGKKLIDSFKGLFDR